MVDITNDSHSRVCESCNAKYCKECKGICMLKIGKKKWRHRFCQHDSRRSRIEDEEDEEKLWRTFPLSNRALLRLIYNVTGTTKSVLDFARAYVILCLISVSFSLSLSLFLSYHITQSLFTKEQTKSD